MFVLHCDFGATVSVRFSLGETAWASVINVQLVISTRIFYYFV